MTTATSRAIATPLETEYKRLVKENYQNSTLPKSGRVSNGQQEDVVTLSSDVAAASKSPARLKPSQPVSIHEKLALQSQFSVYG